MKSAEEIVFEIRDRILKHTAQLKLVSETTHTIVIDHPLYFMKNELRDLLYWIDENENNREKTYDWID